MKVSVLEIYFCGPVAFLQKWVNILEMIQPEFFHLKVLVYFSAIRDKPPLYPPPFLWFGQKEPGKEMTGSLEGNPFYGPTFFVILQDEVGLCQIF